MRASRSSLSLSYLSCSPAIMTSPLCCLAMAFLLMLLVRSMFVICGLEKQVKLTLSYGPFVFTKQPLKHTDPHCHVGKMLCIQRERKRERKTWYGAVRMPQADGIRPKKNCSVLKFMFFCFPILKQFSTVQEQLSLISTKN